MKPFTHIKTNGIYLRMILQCGIKEKEDLISALMNLGFKRKELEKIVDDCLKTFSLEAGFDKLLRESLKKLAKI